MTAIYVQVERGCSCCNYDDHPVALRAFTTQALAEQAGVDFDEVEVVEALPEPQSWVSLRTTYGGEYGPEGRASEQAATIYYDHPEPWWELFVQPLRYGTRYVTVGCSAPDTPETRSWLEKTSAAVVADFERIANDEALTHTWRGTPPWMPEPVSR
jgi:hypothetical protein